jgi:hypothetical protein
MSSRPWPDDIKLVRDRMIGVARRKGGVTPSISRAACQHDTGHSAVEKEQRHAGAIMPSVQQIYCTAYPPLDPGAFAQSFLYLPLPLSALRVPL